MDTQEIDTISRVVFTESTNRQSSSPHHVPAATELDLCSDNSCELEDECVPLRSANDEDNFSCDEQCDLKSDRQWTAESKLMSIPADCKFIDSDSELSDVAS